MKRTGRSFDIAASPLLSSSGPARVTSLDVCACRKTCSLAVWPPWCAHGRRPRGRIGDAMSDIAAGRQQALLAARECAARRALLIVDQAPRKVLRNRGPRPRCDRRRKYQRTEQEFPHGESSLDQRGSVPARSRPAAGFGIVIGTSDASSPDPPHRGHALLIAGVIAGHRPARFGVDRTPRIIIGGLGGADIGTDQKDDTAEYQRIDFQAHLDLPIPP